jgi:hypothetical protein
MSLSLPKNTQTCFLKLQYNPAIPKSAFHPSSTERTGKGVTEALSVGPLGRPQDWYTPRSLVWIQFQDQTRQRTSELMLSTAKFYWRSWDCLAPRRKLIQDQTQGIKMSRGLVVEEGH